MRVGGVSPASILVDGGGDAVGGGCTEGVEEVVCPLSYRLIGAGVISKVRLHTVREEVENRLLFFREGVALLERTLYAMFIALVAALIGSV